MKKTQKLKFLAHFEPHRGGQDIWAIDHEEAVQKGERAARRLGTVLQDITGPDAPEEE